MPSPYPIFPELIPAGSMRSGPYVTSFARNEEELDGILRLRFEVFNLELDEGLQSSFQTRRDEDSFDAQCHHLVVTDTRTGELAGTYRMQTSAMARAHAGFYSDQEFDFSGFPDGVIDNAVELGRACIAKNHRNGRVLFLLWRGLLGYLHENRLRYLFGCCSLATQDPVEGVALWHRLNREKGLRTDFCLEARPAYACPELEVTEEEIELALYPQLMRLYLDYGSHMCSKPAIDRDFKTIDYLTFFDYKFLNPKLAKMLQKDVTKGP